MINTTKTVKFYDDRSKCLDLPTMVQIVFENDEICLCRIEWENQLILFDKETREVLTSNFEFWYATNDYEHYEAEAKRIREENA